MLQCFVDFKESSINLSRVPVQIRSFHYALRIVLERNYAKGSFHVRHPSIQWLNLVPLSKVSVTNRKKGDEDDYGLWRSVNLFLCRHWILGEEECQGTTWWRRSGKNLQKLAMQYGSMQPWFVTSSNLTWSAYMYRNSPFMIFNFNCF